MDSNKVVTPYVLKLSGTPHQIGRAHGAAAKQAGALEVVQFFGTFLDRLFDSSFHSGTGKRLGRAARSFFGETVERHWIERVPQRYRETWAGFAEGSGVPLSVVHRACVAPDAIIYLLGSRDWPDVHPERMASTLGCTSVVAGCGSLPGTDFLHARNLDFLGGALWNQFPAVVEYEPDDGQKYASVTALGIETAGITAMNEAGLVLSLHMHYSHRVQSEAIPITIIGHEIMRRARNLEEAGEILLQMEMSGGWAFVLSSFSEGNAMVAECDAAAIELRGVQKGRLIHTNHFHAESLSKFQYWTSPGRWLDSQARYQRGEVLTDRLGKKPKVVDLVRLLGDTVDPFSEKERGFGCTLSQVHTVHSVVFDPQNKRIHLACGGVPVARQDFLTFDLFPGPRQAEPVIRVDRNPGKDGARSEYGKAFSAYFPQRDLATVVKHLEKAAELDPTEDLYRFLLGWVKAKQGEFDSAVADLEKAVALAVDLHWHGIRRLFLARCLDAKGERKQAKEIYRTLTSDPACVVQARKGMRSRWTLKKTQKTFIDFTLGEVLELGSFSV